MPSMATSENPVSNIPSITFTARYVNAGPKCKDIQRYGNQLRIAISLNDINNCTLQMPYNLRYGTAQMQRRTLVSKSIASARI